MSIISSFQPTGKTITLQTNATPSTSQSCPITLNDIGVQTFPSQVRTVNNGTADVWINFTPSTGTIVVPTAGTTTPGTPQQAIRLKPGVVETFSLNTWAANPNNVQPPSQGFFVQSISSVASQAIDLTFGEGL